MTGIKLYILISRIVGLLINNRNQMLDLVKNVGIRSKDSELLAHQGENHN